MSITTTQKTKKASRAKRRLNSTKTMRGSASSHAGQLQDDAQVNVARSSKSREKANYESRPVHKMPSPASINGADHNADDAHPCAVRPTAQAGKAISPVTRSADLPSPSQSSPDYQGGPVTLLSITSGDSHSPSDHDCHATHSGDVAGDSSTSDGQNNRFNLHGAASEVSSSDGHTPTGTPVLVASGDDDIYRRLKFLHRQRRACIVSQQRAKLPLLSLYRFAYGWQGTLPEAQRKQLKDAAAKSAEAMIKLAETAESQAQLESAAPDDACRAMAGFTLAYAKSAEPIELLRTQLEKEMIVLAKRLPGWSFVESVKGYGAIGLASIVGECGDLSKFSGPAKLWKYLGLAPKSCYVKTDGGVAEIPRARRSISWMYADPMFKHDNPYTKLYRERREYEAANHPEFDTGKTNAKGGKQLTKHCDNRARRYAEKRFLRDLWRAWQAAIKLRKAA